MRKKRRSLKSKEAKKLLQKISEIMNINFEDFFESNTLVEMLEIENIEIIILNQRPLIARSTRWIFPTLFFNEIFSSYPKLVVDMGAVPYVCNGADIMAPGIQRMEGKFAKNDLILIIDEKFGKPLAIGLSLFDSENMKNLEHGKVVKNLHYVGDRLWDFLKDF
jgi:PUA domain protein